MREIVAAAIDQLCAAFERYGYNPTPIIDLGVLIEQENDWHVSSGPSTQPIPRIAPGMTPPPVYAATRQSRSYLDELFG